MERVTEPAALWIEENLGSGPIVKQQFNGSSNWSSSYVYTTKSGAKYFVKTALGQDETMFKGEALSLQAMHGTNTVRVPEVYHYGLMAGRGALRGQGSFIVMEYLELGGALDQAKLGRQLALMHLADPTDEHAKRGQFGFAVDNTIGGTPQPNGWMDDWVDFFRERRLRHQLDLAGEPSLSRMGEKVMDNLHVFFEGVEVRPSILHGDLWSGNIASAGGRPVILDPATYYGHHEAEFGMSWCAGFSQSFYDSYHSVIPRAPGFEQRKQLYLLYHYLNHYNLFGSGYYNQCSSILQRLVSSL